MSAAETLTAFRARVQERTGFPFDAIPRGEAADLLGGQILCRRGALVVVTYGYPDERDPETGEEVWTRAEGFRIVDTLVTATCGCGRRLAIRSPRQVTHIALWCGHLDVDGEAREGEVRPIPDDVAVQCAGRP